MAKGSSKIGGGSTYNVTSVVTQGGITLDLTNNPLVYGQKEKEVQGTLRSALETQENKRRGAKIEYGMLYDEYGNPIISEKKGGKNGVSMPVWAYNRATAMTHNHPRGKGEEGNIGGTFSVEDMDAFSTFSNLKTMRAAAAEGTYSITKGKNFNAKGFASFAKSSSKQRESEMSTTIKNLSTAFAQQSQAGQNPSYRKYRRDCSKAFNTFLINCHNDLISGQKQYGYSYVLER